MERDNRDLFPSEETCALYRTVIPLVANPLTQAAFTAREDKANRFKKCYHRLGRLAMVCVVGGALYTVGQALLLLDAPAWIGVTAAIAAGLGLAIEVFLIQSRQKQNWLNNRFAAERIRSINFQAYALAPACSAEAELVQKVDHYCRQELTLLDNELNASRSVLKSFSPRSALSRLPIAVPPSSSPLGEAARDAYVELRTRYQAAFAANEAEKLEGSLRIDYTVADLLYLSGACLTVLALVIKLIPQVVEWSRWVDFLAVTAFILGLAKTMIDNASLGEESRVRYLDYHHTLEAVRHKAGELPETILAVETAALDELRQFCRSADRITYRL